MPLTQLVCEVSQLQVERQTVLIFICIEGVSQCSTCTSRLPNLIMWYTKDLCTPGVFPEIAVQSEALILALKIRTCRNKLSVLLVQAAVSIHPGLRHQYMEMPETPLAPAQPIQSLSFLLPLAPLEHTLHSS